VTRCVDRKPRASYRNLKIQTAPLVSRRASAVTKRLRRFTHVLSMRQICGCILLGALPRIPLTVVLLGAAVSLSACTSTCSRQTSTPVPGGTAAQPPTVWSLVLDIQEGEVRLVDARPARGKIVAPRIDERLASLRNRDSLWIEYAVRSDASKQVLHTGAFAVSTTAIVEPGGADEPGGTIRVRRRFVNVAVPYVSEPASVVFSRVEPGGDRAVDRWARVPIGTVALKGGPR
jgi:hypothetical protein